MQILFYIANRLIYIHLFIIKKKKKKQQQKKEIINAYTLPYEVQPKQLQRLTILQFLYLFI